MSPSDKVVFEATALAFTPDFKRAQNLLSGFEPKTQLVLEYQEIHFQVIIMMCIGK